MSTAPSPSESVRKLAARFEEKEKIESGESNDGTAGGPFRQPVTPISCNEYSKRPRKVSTTISGIAKGKQETKDLEQVAIAKETKSKEEEEEEKKKEEEEEKEDAPEIDHREDTDERYGESKDDEGGDDANEAPIGDDPDPPSISPNSAEPSAESHFRVSLRNSMPNMGIRFNAPRQDAADRSTTFGVIVDVLIFIAGLSFLCVFLWNVGSSHYLVVSLSDFADCPVFSVSNQLHICKCKHFAGKYHESFRMALCEYLDLLSPILGIPVFLFIRTSDIVHDVLWFDAVEFFIDLGFESPTTRKNTCPHDAATETEEELSSALVCPIAFRAREKPIVGNREMYPDELWLGRDGITKAIDGSDIDGTFGIRTIDCRQAFPVLAGSAEERPENSATCAEYTRLTTFAKGDVCSHHFEESPFFRSGGAPFPRSDGGTERRGNGSNGFFLNTCRLTTMIPSSFRTSEDEANLDSASAGRNAQDFSETWSFKVSALGGSFAFGRNSTIIAGVRVDPRWLSNYDEKFTERESCGTDDVVVRRHLERLDARKPFFDWGDICAYKNSGDGFLDRKGVVLHENLPVCSDEHGNSATSTWYLNQTTLKELTSFLCARESKGKSSEESSSSVDCRRRRLEKSGTLLRDVCSSVAADVAGLLGKTPLVARVIVSHFDDDAGQPYSPPWKKEPPFDGLGQGNVLASIPLFVDSGSVSLGAPPEHWHWRKDAVDQFAFTNRRLKAEFDLWRRSAFPDGLEGDARLRKHDARTYWKLRGFLGEMENGAKPWCC